VLVFFLNHWVMFLLYGDKYLGYGHTIIVLALSLLVGSLALPFAAAVTVLEKPKAIFIASLFSFGVTFVMAMVLVPRWELRGAAYSVLIGSSAGLVVNWLLLWRLVDQAHLPEECKTDP